MENGEAQNDDASGPVGQERPRILFATIAAGGSHVSTAHALAEAIECHYPGEFDLAVREPMLDYGFEELDRRHKESWKRALGNPWTIVWGQVLIDAFPRLTAAFHRRFLAEFARRAAHELAAEPPDLIVVNHGWLMTAFTLAQRRFGLQVPVVTFETSTINANALWAEPNAERVIVASPESKRRLLRFGLSEARVDVVGYPVRQAFLRAPGRDEARQMLGLADEFTCLVSLGGEGVGGTPEKVARALLRLEGVQVVVVCGRNEELRRHLAGLGHPRLVVVGFVEEMPLYLAASDVVIGKPGPASVFEAIAVGRPLLSPMRSGTVENKMSELLAVHGLGGYRSTLEVLTEDVAAYRDEPRLLEEAADRAARLDFAGMAERLARYLVGYLRTGAPDASAVGSGVPLEPEHEGQRAW